MKFAVIGGDTRQLWLARLLRADGHWVKTAALGDDSGVPVTRQMAQALEDARYVIFPLPAAAAGETLNAPLEQESVNIRDVLGLIDPETRVLAGRCGDTFKKLAAEKGLRTADYFEREELTVRNAAITAEGAVELLMRELPVTILGARILVTGFGRIGRLLALKLRALGADVTVSARRQEDFALIDSLGLHGIDTRELSGRLWSFRAVVNTVPARIFDNALLGQLDAGCLCVDLASVPGGFDTDAVAELGTRFIHALGLPGKSSPESAGAAVRDTIYNIISEWECAE